MRREENALSPSDAVRALGWMAGSWIEDQEERRCEEIWSSPDADTLMGMFRWISEEEVSFYEFMVIKSTEKGAELHVKHFHPTLIGWEERERFQGFALTEVEEGHALFVAIPPDDDPDAVGGALTYQLNADDTLTVQLIQPTGEIKLTFHFRREASA